MKNKRNMILETEMKLKDFFTQFENLTKLQKVFIANYYKIANTIF